jgi:predicted Zn-dependent protease
VSSQDELASVLAHELSHITQRHIARLISRQSAQGPILLGAMILGALAAASNPQAATALIAGGQAVAVQGQLNFSRDMEREADRVGYSVLTDSGFMPQGFVSMFEKLQQANRFNDTGAFPYLRSHPLTTERIADMQARQQLLPVVVSKTQLQHVLLAARARALSQLGVDAQRGLMQRAAAQSATALPEQRAAALYSGVLAALTQRAYFQAELWHTELLKLTVRDPAAQRLSRLLGVELALAQGQPALALQQLGSDARSAARAELVFWSQATLALLRQQPEPEGALLISRLQSRVLSHPSDALAWQLLSSAYGVQGNTLRSVTAEAEMFAARLDDQGALNRYRAAQDKLRQMPQPDNIEASIIDTRVRQLAARIREQALER